MAAAEVRRALMLLAIVFMSRVGGGLVVWVCEVVVERTGGRIVEGPWNLKYLVKRLGGVVVVLGF